MTAVEELGKLQQLHADGTITDEQYENARTKLLEEQCAALDDPERIAEYEPRRPRRERSGDDDRRLAPRARREKAREWCMMLHLALLAGHVVPFGGIIAPIVIWQAKKEDIPDMDEHGRNAVNWVISFVIYVATSAVLCFALIGFVLLPAVLLMNLVFPIVAALKAKDGRVWKYPLAIPFFK
jgi:uncharacterized Tic20 family protein